MCPYDMDVSSLSNWSYAPVYLSWGDIHVLELCSCLLKLGGHPCPMSYAPVYLSWGDIHVLLVMPLFT
jgi:hypothetical protein